MESILVSENGTNSGHVAYVYNMLSERFALCSAKTNILCGEDRTALVLDAENKYVGYLRSYAAEQVAEVIAIGYKYDYLNTHLSLHLLTQQQREILFCILISADFLDDKKYILSRLKYAQEYSIDGFYRFRLQALTEKWKGVVEYIPADFTLAETQKFIEFVLEENKGTIYIKSGEVYDEKYHLLQRKKLTSGILPLVREIILSGANKIYMLDKADDDTMDFIKKYYGGHTIFS